MPRVFISYRRDDTGQAASALAVLLRDHLSHEVVFLDHDDMEFGEPWRRYLNEAIIDRDVVLCLIGRDWEGKTDDPPHRRIDEPADAVRQEIAIAAAAGVRILAVRVDRDDVPTNLPVDISDAITESHIVPLRSTDYLADFSVILVKLWELRLARLPSCHVVLTVGSTDIGCGEFIDALRHGHTSSGEVRVVTLAATGRMTLSLVDAKELAPRLFTLYLADDADERDRRVVAAWGLPGHWDKLAVVTGGLTVGYSFTALVAAPGYEWLGSAIGDTGSIEVAVSAAGATPNVGPPSGTAWGRARHAVAARPRVALLAGALAVGGGVAVVATQGDANDDEVTAASVVPGDELDSPEALVAALLRAGEADAADPDTTPLTRRYYDEQFPCMAEFVVDRLGPAEIKARVGVTVASIDEAIAADEVVYFDNLIWVEDENGSSSYDFDYYLDRTDAEVECAGGLLEAERWNEFRNQSFLDSVALEDGFDYVDCLIRFAQPTADELAASVYYWYYADGGTGGPLADDPESYGELSASYRSRNEDAKDVCGYGP